MSPGFCPKTQAKGWGNDLVGKLFAVQAQILRSYVKADTAAHTCNPRILQRDGRQRPENHWKLEGQLAWHMQW